MNSELKNPTEVAIKEFINSNDGSKHTQVVLKGKDLKGSGVLVKSSRIINRNISKQTRSEVLVDIIGSGELREITIVADTAINVILKVDGENLLQGISQWSELNAITAYTDIITAKTDGTNYIFVINKIRFYDHFFLQVYFDSNATISSIFGVYDLFKVM